MNLALLPRPTSDYHLAGTRDMDAPYRRIREDALLLADACRWFASRNFWEKAALFNWAAILVFVSARAFGAPENRTVYPIFSASARLWWSGGELYEPHRPKDVASGYKYSPTVAILMTPFALLPDSVGGVVWRWFSLAAMLAAMAWLARSVGPGAASFPVFAGLALAIIPLTLQSFNNGQANLIVAACMLATVAAVKEERWNLAAVFLAMAFACKVYPIALGMVLILLYPRGLAWRVVLGVVASLVLPFPFQRPAYVIDQYMNWIECVRADDRSATSLHHMYRDLWLLIHIYGVPISRETYTIIQFAGGALVAFVCWQRQRSGWSESSLLTSTLALVSAWMMLLGPATESSSFVLLAPSLAWSIVEAIQARVRTLRHGLLWGACVIFFIASIVGGINKDWMIHDVGVHTWGTLTYLAYLLTERREPTVQVAVEVEPQRLAA